MIEVEVAELRRLELDLLVCPRDVKSASSPSSRVRTTRTYSSNSASGIGLCPMRRHAVLPLPSVRNVRPGANRLMLAMAAAVTGVMRVPTTATPSGGNLMRDVRVAAMARHVYTSDQIIVHAGKRRVAVPELFSSHDVVEIIDLRRDAQSNVHGPPKELRPSSQPIRRVPRRVPMRREPVFVERPEISCRTRCPRTVRRSSGGTRGG